jgi:hypothetical protein
MGPISYLIVEFPGNQMTGEGFAALVDLVDRGIIRILDLEFVRRDDDGSIIALSAQELDTREFDLMIFEGASAGLLDETDLDDVRDVIQPGTSAGILLFENTWAQGFVQGMRNGGAEVVAAGYIPLEAVAAALDATEQD